MNNGTMTPVRTIKKLYVGTTVEFAINNIPDVDQDTLEKFLELVNATGNFGPISEGEIIEKMNLIMKYIPGACARSLLTIIELLDIRFPRPPVTNQIARLVTPLEETKLISSARLH
ncbi:MAG: hypothetical protein JXM69_14420 [Anaerolineae bacterium]|nr:hypothetical protein [Anaerolineae bacterium]